MAHPAGDVPKGHDGHSAGESGNPSLRPPGRPPSKHHSAHDDETDRTFIGLESTTPQELGIQRDEVQAWLTACKGILLADGFKREPLRQARKPGMVWGLIRQEADDMQIHVRAFKDGRLETEVELSNRFIQHLWSHRRSAHPEVTEILGRHGMPIERVSHTFMPITGSKSHKKMPEGRTRVAHLLAPALGLLAAWLLWRAVKPRQR